MIINAFKFIILVVIASVIFIFPGVVYADFTATVPAGTEVTMQDPQAVIPVTITNTGPTRDIRIIVFRVNAGQYNISDATVPPPGWCVNNVNNQRIVFALIQGNGSCGQGSTASEISPGESLLFNITVLPLSASADVSGDTFARIRVQNQNNINLSGPLPTWTRRSLEASLSSAPGSVGVGEELTLTMQVTNRSTVSQSTVSSLPAPPSPSSVIVSFQDGPYYGSTLLDGQHTSSSTVITVDSTSEFPSIGTVRIGAEEICYTGITATTFTGATRGCNGTTASAHSDNSTAYRVTPFSLAPGQTGTMTWKYSADITGSVYFSARGTNAVGTARSVNLNSNTVIIGDFAASLFLSPASAISGDTVTATMLVTNNGTGSLINVTPSTPLGCAGGAVETLVTGPVPTDIFSLAPGSSGLFSWTYQITGSVGEAYCLTGNASADGPVTTNTTTSNSGTVSVYSVNTQPTAIASGTTNQTITWTVYNGSGCGIRSVRVATPASGGDWACSSVAPPAGWNASCANTVNFRSTNGAFDIPTGGSQNFSITFSTTETVTADKVVSFPVRVRPRGCGNNQAWLGSYVTVTANAVSLAHSPAGPIFADGSSFYTITATLTSNGSPVSGKSIDFLTSNGTLSSSTATTDSNGEATVSLFAPNSTTDTTSDVTASYLNAEGTDTVSFAGWTLANLQYWGSLSPLSVDCGTSYSFTMNVKNVSGSTMNLTTGSYFAFNDSASGGSGIYVAYLDSATSLSVGQTKTLTFGSPTSAGGGGGVAVDSTFTAGSYSPIPNSSPPPESGLFFTDGGTNDQYRGVTDAVMVGGTCGKVRIYIIDWHEMR